MRDWKIISKKLVYDNKWIKVYEHKIIRPDGKDGIYAVIEKSPAVFVIAQDNDGSIYLLKEFRFPIKKEVINLPCGSLGNEDVISGAKRELLEETGIKANKWEVLGGVYIAPGFETTHGNIVLATELDIKSINLLSQDGDESIRSVFKVSRSELSDLIRENKIEDMSTLGALCLYFSRFTR